MAVCAAHTRVCLHLAPLGPDIRVAVRLLGGAANAERDGGGQRPDLVQGAVSQHEADQHDGEGAGGDGVDKLQGGGDLDPPGMEDGSQSLGHGLGHQGENLEDRDPLQHQLAPGRILKSWSHCQSDARNDGFRRKQLSI